MFSPSQKDRTVEAEFDRLPGRSVAIVIFAQPGVDFAHPRARIDLANAIAYDLQQNVEGIRVLPPTTVLRYQRENLDWDATPRRELAKTLGVDYVLHLGLEEYSLSDPISGLFQARITADVNLYTAGPSVGPADDDGRAWTGRLRVIYPDDNSARAIVRDDGTAQGDARALFAKLLVRKFHQHKIPADEQ